MMNTPLNILLRNNSGGGFSIKFIVKRHMQIILSKLRVFFSSFIYPKAAESLYYCLAEPKINWKKQGQC